MHSYSIAEEHQVNSPSAGIIHKFNELGSSAVDMEITNATPKSTITSVRETCNNFVFTSKKMTAFFYLLLFANSD